MADPFIHEHISDLLVHVRTKALLTLVKPYSNVKLDFISNELGISLDEVESLLVSCILDKCIEGNDSTKISSSNLKFWSFVIKYKYTYHFFRILLMFLSYAGCSLTQPCCFTGRIDQVNKILVMRPKGCDTKYLALEKLTEQIGKLTFSIGAWCFLLF